MGASKPLLNSNYCLYLQQRAGIREQSGIVNYRWSPDAHWMELLMSQKEREVQGYRTKEGDESNFR